MTIPAISNNINTSIGTITATSTTVIIPILPPSDTVLALTLGTPPDSSDDDSVDQQSMEPLFHQLGRCTTYK